LAIPAVEATIDAAIAGSAAAVRYCATNPACRQKAAELGISSVATVAVALGIDVATNHPDGKPNTPITTPPMITPIEAQKEFGPPPLENTQALGEWVDNVLEGYPADSVTQWVDELIKGYPAAQQQSIKDQILLSVQDNYKHHLQLVNNVKGQLASQGYEVNSKEVTFGSSCGTGRCRPDIVAIAPDGKIKIIEIKTGSAELSIRQSEIYPQIENGDSIPRGSVAEALGLDAGTPLKEQGYPNGIPIEIMKFPGVRK
ncbi:hypothetical protein, partial [Methylobacillus sp. Pita1]|uniref:hypothetical protein n=1 Tax=Methylobacillus sp. Pita1 TaxID=3382642 RepID=UPI0038B427E5